MGTLAGFYHLLRCEAAVKGACAQAQAFLPKEPPPWCVVKRSAEPAGHMQMQNCLEETALPSCHHPKRGRWPSSHFHNSIIA